MKITFFPKTKLGAWAVGLVAMWPIFTILGMVVMNNLYFGVEAGNGLIDDLRVRPFFAVTMLVGILLGVTSFPMSLVAIVRRGERSVLSVLATLLGLLLIILLGGEFLIKH